MNDVSQDGPDPLIGANIGGKYRIVKLLGEGGMGCVYLGEQQMGSSVRKVAVKTLHKHLSMDPQIRARFSRECGTVSELEHPNTIQVYDFGTTDDGLLYIVMEFVQGRSLADILEKDGPMPADRALNILTQVCGSLEEAHHRGIVHRDLKPDNVVLCEKAGKKDWVEVLDFGIAKRSSETDPNEQKLTQQGMVLGTPPYMSPEQFTGQPINASSDIYSLGVMTYEMLTGKLPFNGNTAWEWASQHMTAQPQPFEVQPNGNLLPPAMRAAVMRSLEKAPEARFASVTEYLEALKGGPASAPVAQPPSGGAGRAKTEMAAPAVSPPGMAPGAYGPPMGGPPMGGPPMGGPPIGGPPMGGPPMGGPPMGGPPAYAAVPAAPAHSPGRKSGGAGLFIGLGIGALVLIGGGIAVAVSMSGGSSASTQPSAALTFSSPPPTASSTAAAATTEEHHDDGNLAALNTSKATGGGGGGGGAAGPKATGKASAIPTPGKATSAPTAPPAACALAARYKGSNPTMYERYATLCRAGGGTPP